MSNQGLTRIIMMVLTTFVFVYLIIPFIRKVAIHVGALDIPDKRKVHKEPIPRMGGLGYF